MRQPSPRWEAPSTRAISRPTDGFSATTTVLIPPAYHKLPHCARRAGGAGSQWPAVPAASAFGSDSTQTRPTSRGRVFCGAFLAARWCGQTAPGPRAGAGRLRRLETATVIRSQNRRRRQVPARGLAAVCPHIRSIRNETKHPSPLSVGLGRVNTEPKALSGGTAAPQAASPCSWTCRRLHARSPHSERNEAPKPPARGAWARRPGAEGSGCRHRRLALMRSLCIFFRLELTFGGVLLIIIHYKMMLCG